MKRIVNWAIVLFALAAPCSAQEISCKELMRQCGDGPYEMRNQNGLLSSVGGGTVSNECVATISGVLATYQSCHGQLAYAGGAAIILHFVHENPDFLKQTGWECARSSFSKVFACQQ